jgi:5-hydroxyisourate hydrolase
MGLSTHVLDTAHGRPGAGMAYALWRVGAHGAHEALARGRTDEDGRVLGGLLPQELLTAGRYILVFHVAEYFRAQGVALPDPPFLDEVTLAFGVADTTVHYHVPLLVSPYGYTTYRGS